MFAHLLWCVCDELINECKPFCFDNVCVREGKKARKYLIIITIIINPFDEEQMNGSDGKMNRSKKEKSKEQKKQKRKDFCFSPSSFSFFFVINLIFPLLSKRKGLLFQTFVSFSVAKSSPTPPI